MNPERFPEQGLTLADSIQEEAEPSSLDYEEKIVALRDQITQAEAQMNEERVLALENELRLLEQEKKTSLEHFRVQADYEAARSAVVSRFEEINTEVRNQTESVKQFENTDEGRYHEALAQLREREQERNEAGIFLSQYWGQNPEAHRDAEGRFLEDLSSAETLQDLVEKITHWGGVPRGGEGGFLTASEFSRQIEGNLSPEDVTKRFRELGIDQATVEQVARVVEKAQEVSMAPEATVGQESPAIEKLVDEYNKTFLEEMELREINDFVHSRMFQSGMGFKVWALLPANRRKLALLAKYNIDYDNAQARRSSATMGTAFRLREVTERKRELEGLLPHVRSSETMTRAPQKDPEQPVPEAEPFLPVELPAESQAEAVIPEVAEEGVVEDSEYEYEKEETPKTVEETLRKLEEVAGVHSLPEGAPLVNEGREMKRRLKELTEERKLLERLQKALQSKLFTAAPAFYPHGKELLLKLSSLGIPFGTIGEKQQAEAKLAELWQKTSVEWASLTGKKADRSPGGHPERVGAHKNALPRIKREKLSESGEHNQIQL